MNAPAVRRTDADLATETICEDIARGSLLQFTGGMVELRKPTTEQSIAAALDWIKMLNEVATDLRASCGSELSRETLARRIESRCARATEALAGVDK